MEKDIKLQSDFKMEDCNHNFELTHHWNKYKWFKKIGHEYFYRCTICHKEEMIVRLHSDCTHNWRLVLQDPIYEPLALKCAIGMEYTHVCTKCHKEKVSQIVNTDTKWDYNNIKRYA